MTLADAVELGIHAASPWVLSNFTAPRMNAVQPIRASSRDH
jgi:hypothetical protein